MWMTNVENCKLTHSKFVSMMFEKKNLGFIDRAVSSELSGLWWEKLRYKYGADNDVYKTPDFSATGDQPTSSALAPTIDQVPAVILPLASAEAAIASPVVALTPSLLSASQTNPAVVEPATTVTVALEPTTSLLTTKKHAKGLRSAGIVIGSITVVAILGYFIFRKRKSPKRVEELTQAEKL